MEDVEAYGPREWQRFYMGYRERFVDNCVLELQEGAVKVQLAQAPSASSASPGASRNGNRPGKRTGGTSAAERDSDPALTGTTVWDGGVVLSQALTCTDWLDAHRQGRPWPSGAARPHCVELGAGTGAVGLSLAACHKVSSSTLTDIPEMLPHLTKNMQLNAAAVQAGPRRSKSQPPRPRGPSVPPTPDGGGAATLGQAAPAGSSPGLLLPRPPQVLVRPLRWGQAGEVDIQALQQEQQHLQQRTPSASPPPGPPYDLIVGSDLIYYTYSEATPHTKLLLWTLERVACTSSLIYLALSLHHNPDEVEHFLGLAEDKFEVLRLQSQVPHPWRVHDSLVVMLRLRKDSDSESLGTAEESTKVEVATEEAPTK